MTGGRCIADDQWTVLDAGGDSDDGSDAPEEVGVQVGGSGDDALTSVAVPRDSEGVVYVAGVVRSETTLGGATLGPSTFVARWTSGMGFDWHARLSEQTGVVSGLHVSADEDRLAAVGADPPSVAMFQIDGDRMWRNDLDGQVRNCPASEMRRGRVWIACNRDAEQNEKSNRIVVYSLLPGGAEKRELRTDSSLNATARDIELAEAEGEFYVAGFGDDLGNTSFGDARSGRDGFVLRRDPTSSTPVQTTVSDWTGSDRIDALALVSNAVFVGGRVSEPPGPDDAPGGLLQRCARLEDGVQCTGRQDGIWYRTRPTQSRITEILTGRDERNRGVYAFSDDLVGLFARNGKQRANRAILEGIDKNLHDAALDSGGNRVWIVGSTTESLPDASNNGRSDGFLHGFTFEQQ